MIGEEIQTVEHGNKQFTNSDGSIKTAVFVRIEASAHSCILPCSILTFIVYSGLDIHRGARRSG